MCAKLASSLASPFSQTLTNIADEGEILESSISMLQQLN